MVVGHGQMGEDELEQVMLDFIDRKFDVLLATTIIENGIDIPNANTIIINRADRYGLAQLYQLRGRVGRIDRPAYAYLLIPPEQSLSPVAQQRLAAIQEFSDLGSGFRVAALDLEIRGAGNLLGGEQSGHIDAVGFEMYMKLLEETVRELKGEELDDDVRTTVNLKMELRIDETYIADTNQRLSVYRKVAQARRGGRAGPRARRGSRSVRPAAASVLVLAGYAQIRLMAERAQGRVHRPRRLDGRLQDAAGRAARPGAAHEVPAGAAGRARWFRQRRLSSTCSVARRAGADADSRGLVAARATAGQVAPGFSSGASSSVVAPEDPRAGRRVARPNPRGAAGPGGAARRTAVGAIGSGLGLGRASES